MSYSDPRENMSRRTAVKLTTVGLLGVAAGLGSAALVPRMGGAAAGLYRFFTVGEAALLIDICEQLIPVDDTPGATDARIIHYIDRQLSGPLRRHQGAYRQGLVSFDRACVAESGAPFSTLMAAQKIEMLQRVESGNSAKNHWNDLTPAAFFRLVLTHTMQGFYGPARHGGNRGHIAYKVLGLDYPQVIGQNRYRQEGA